MLFRSTFCWPFGEVVRNIFNFSGWLTVMHKGPWVQICRMEFFFKNVLCSLMIVGATCVFFLQPVALYFSEVRLIFLPL